MSGRNGTAVRDARGRFASGVRPSYAVDGGDLGTKARYDSSDYVAATVTEADTWGGRGSARDPVATQLVARAEEWAAICLELNASVCAGQPMRLYAKRGTAEKMARRGKVRSGLRVASSPVSRRKAAWLRSPVPGYGPGGKSALYAERAGDVEEITSHPILDVLERPNPWQTSREFSHAVFQSMEITGNAFVFQVVTREGPIVERYRLLPQWVTVIPSETDFIAGYLYGRDTRDQEIFAEDEVVHFRHWPHPSNPFYGWGPLQRATRSVDIYSAAQQNELATWQNGARPDFIFEAPAQMTEDEIRVARRKIEAQMAGPRNRGRFLITSSLKSIPMQFTPRDMEYLAGKQDLKRTIFAAFGVPESLAELNDANLASSKTGHVQYMRLTILPRLCTRAEIETENVIPAFGVEPGDLWFAYDNPVPDDEAALVSKATAFVGAGLWSINEARAEDGYEPIQDGDVHRVNGVPLDLVGVPAFGPVGGGVEIGDGFDSAPEIPDAEEVATTADSVQETAMTGVQITALQGLLQAVSDGTQSPDVVYELVLASFPTMDPARARRMVDAAASFAATRTEEPPPASEDSSEGSGSGTVEDARDGLQGDGKGSGFGEILNSIARSTARIIDEEEKDLATRMRETTQRSDEILDEMRDEVADTAEEIADEMFGKAGQRKPTGEMVAAVRDWMKDADVSVGADGKVTLVADPDALAERMMPAIRSSYDRAERSAMRAARNAGATGVSKVGIDEDVASAIAKQVAEDIIATEQARIDGLVESMGDEDAIDDVAASVRDELRGPYGAAKAEMVAATETQYHDSIARSRVWAAAGVKKRWKLSGDPCPACVGFAKKFNRPRKADGVFAEVGSTFKDADGKDVTVGYRDVIGPPLHPNCRCSLVPVVE